MLTTLVPFADWSFVISGLRVRLGRCSLNCIVGLFWKQILTQFPAHPRDSQSKSDSFPETTSRSSSSRQNARENRHSWVKTPRVETTTPLANGDFHASSCNSPWGNRGAIYSWLTTRKSDTLLLSGDDFMDRLFFFSRPTIYYPKENKEMTRTLMAYRWL